MIRTKSEECFEALGNAFPCPEDNKVVGEIACLCGHPCVSDVIIKAFSELCFSDHHRGKNRTLHPPECKCTPSVGFV